MPVYLLMRARQPWLAARGSLWFAHIRMTRSPGALGWMQRAIKARAWLGNRGRDEGGAAGPLQ